jgi:DUF4097 and DUF4098 domain-containing protein YvlB
MKALRTVVSTAIALAAVAGCDDSTGPIVLDFEWRGTIAQADAIEIKGFNGDIVATASSENTVTVTATKEGQQDDPEDVRIELIEHAGGVTICAIYPDVPGQPTNSCGAGDQGHLASQDNDVEVTFTVAVPAGVDFVGKTVNGSVSGTSLTSDAFATTVNGDVTVATTQLGTALTVNGSITVTIGLTDWNRDLEFTTVNGDVTVEVPAGTNAEVRLATTNGTISTEFSLTQVTATDVRGTIGNGGRLLRLTTVNGNVALERGP